jgi:hypothetical protein
MKHTNTSHRYASGRSALLISLAAVWLAACSSEQLYATGRNAQRAECMKQADATARDRCLKDAGMSHDA